ncbi:hypothetical protein GCM10010381_32310 [Streptomyces xantholiticus]|nr:hypothetical protein GCM10010381_32310 [Streptomyces xantholiticus]
MAASATRRSFFTARPRLSLTYEDFWRPTIHTDRYRSVTYADAQPPHAPPQLRWPAKQQARREILLPGLSSLWG